MSTRDKLLFKLVKNPKDFTFRDGQSLLGKLGYVEDTLGKTSGSRVAFFHPQTQHVIRLHKPHPNNELKEYAVKELIQSLKDKGYID